uniref:ABC transporter permease n=1 Tax=Sandarakinorhabdus sp. TaxID=1916663 RepID=UPI00286E2939
MSLPLRLALRELRGGLAGLRILALCLVLGVAALAGVGSLTSAINAGLAERGQFVLGGDVSARLSGRFASPAEAAALAQAGSVGRVVKLRAMVGRQGGDLPVLAEIKAVDDNWPLYGTVKISGGARLRPGTAAAQQALADRLRLKPGDLLTLGGARLRYIGTLDEEPDRAGDGFGLGPGLVMHGADLESAGLLGTGSLFRSEYRVRLPANVSPAAALARLEPALKPGGAQFTDRSNGAPGTRRFVAQLGQFLALVGLTALVVAGVGVAGGVSAYLGARTRTIATLKTLGADTATIRAVYLWQIGLVTAGAVAIGLAIGAVTPLAVARIAAASLPVPPATGPQWAALVVAAAYGVLIALAFALWPLAQGARMPAARLFRSLTERGVRPGAGTVAIIAAAAAAILAITVLVAQQRLYVIAFLVGALALIARLWLLAALVRW